MPPRVNTNAYVFQDKIPIYRDINRSSADTSGDGAAAVPKERGLMADTRGLDRGNPQLPSALKEPQAARPQGAWQRARVAERMRGDSTEDFLGWMKWDKNTQGLSSWDPAREQGLGTWTHG